MDWSASSELFSTPQLLFLLLSRSSPTLSHSPSLLRLYLLATPLQVSLGGVGSSVAQLFFGLPIMGAQHEFHESIYTYNGTNGMEYGAPGDWIHQATHHKTGKKPRKIKHLVLNLWTRGGGVLFLSCVLKVSIDRSLLPSFTPVTI